MKKLIVLFLAVTIWSCNNEEQVNTDVPTAAVTSESVLEGKVLSFKNEESFVKEYSSLAALHSEELKKWVSSKGLVSLLNVPTESVEMEGDVIPESKVIYSDALKSVLNSESKVKIAGKVLWLNERNFYLLSENEINKTSDDLLNEKDNLEIYGQLLSISKSNKNITSRYVLPNENRIKTFSSEEMNVSGSRLRHVVDLYNETIILNDAIQTSKMFVRSTLQYRSCSTFRCTWKEAFNVRNVISNFCECTSGGWSLISDISTINGVTGTQTYLISSWSLLPAPAHPDILYTNFIISGPITCSIVGASVSGVSINLSWY
ncbi:hypothetical protein D3C85_602640 [compost metagenome]